MSTAQNKEKEKEKGRYPTTKERYPEMRFVRLALPIETHRKFRMFAASRDSNMSQVARLAVEHYLKTGGCDDVKKQRG